MLLKTQFDIDQVSDVLAWHFVRLDGAPNPDHGKDAGMISFTAGQDFHVQIEATGKDAFNGFTVLDCCMITRPFIYSCGPKVPTEYAPPSMFAPKLLGEIVPATIRLPGQDFEVILKDAAAPPYHSVLQAWCNHLTVGGFLGRWDMSFVLTVKILRKDGTSKLRVFSFDPETDVGSGSLMPEPMPAMLNLVPETDPGSGSL